MADGPVLTLVFGAGSSVVVVLAFACAALITPRRTYYPLLRLLFMALAGLYGGLATATAMGSAGDARLRVAAVGGLALTLALCVAFIRRRNQAPQWVALDVRGLPEAIDPAQLEHDVLAILALVRHGMADADLIAELEGAIAAWRAFRRWREDELPAEIAARLVRALAERDRQARWREELAAGGKLPRRGVR